MNELLPPTPDYLIEQDNDRRRRGGGAQRYLTAVEFVLLFTPRLVGKNAGVHPAARGIVPLLRSAYPPSAATMRWWIFLDDFVQYGSSSFDATLDKHSFAGATIDLSAPTLTLRSGRARGAWKEVKYIVSRSCKA